MFLIALSHIEPTAFFDVDDESRKWLLQAAFINHEGKRKKDGEPFCCCYRGSDNLLKRAEYHLLFAMYPKTEYSIIYSFSVAT